MKKQTSLITAAVLLLLPAVASAQTTLYNPLPSSDIRVIIGTFIRAILGLSGALALVMFIWGGFQWMISQGVPAKVQKGKDTLIWATLGLVIIFTAYTLVSVVISTLTTATG